MSNPVATILFLTGLLFCGVAYGQAQQEKKTDDLPRPREVKVLDEHKDKNGNTIRTIQYRQGKELVTETEIIPEVTGVRVPIDPDTLDKDSVLVVIDKSKYRLDVFYRRHRIRSYKAVFGPRPLLDKTMSGDRATPEGKFKIQTKNANSKYDRFMLLDYPNDSSIARFNRLKEEGVLPQSARIGGDIGIHGVWKGGDDMIDMGVCWTDGCVALKNKDIEELFKLVGVGTTVYIRK